MNKIFLSILLLFIILVPQLKPLKAQCGGLSFPDQGTIFGPTSGCKIEDPASLITVIIPIILGIAGFLTIIYIVISGIQFITSSGNPEGAAAARGRLTFAIVGLILIILAFAILQIVNKIFLGSSII